EAAVGDEDRAEREDQPCRHLDEVADAEIVEIGLALDQRVAEVEQEGQAEQGIEPVPAPEEEVLVALVVVEPVGEEQGGEQEQRRAVADEEGKDAEAPVLEPAQLELPPPEQHQFNEDREAP